MDFKKLQKMQRALDNAILAEKPEMSAEERFNKTLVALSVELAEVANCSEHFKHWKINKGKVDTEKFKGDRESGYLNFGEIIPDSESENHRVAFYEFEQAHHLTLVEEAADCLHFILSLANQMDCEVDVSIEFIEQFEDTIAEAVYLQLQGDISRMSHLTPFNTHLTDWFYLYLHKLDITTDELEQAYYAKNEVNYQRLREGY